MCCLGPMTSLNKWGDLLFPPEGLRTGTWSLPDSSCCHCSAGPLKPHGQASAVMFLKPQKSSNSGFRASSTARLSPQGPHSLFLPAWSKPAILWYPGSAVDIWSEGSHHILLPLCWSHPGPAAALKCLCLARAPCSYART